MVEIVIHRQENRAQNRSRRRNPKIVFAHIPRRHFQRLAAQSALTEGVNFRVTMENILGIYIGDDQPRKKILQFLEFLISPFVFQRDRFHLSDGYDRNDRSISAAKRIKNRFNQLPNGQIPKIN